MTGYAVTLTRRYDGLFTATFADVPGAVAFGRDQEEALEEAAASLRAELARRLKRGEAPPAPRAGGTLRIDPAVEVRHFA
jgi:predicted RNase H-like HicB family nuclease